MNLIELVLKDHELNQFIEKLPNSKRSLLTGVNPSSTVLLIQTLLERLKKHLHYIVENEAKAQNLAEALNGVLPSKQIFTFPMDPMIATQGAFASFDEMSQRILALNFLGSKQKGIVIATPQALQYQLSQPDLFFSEAREFKVGQEYVLAELNAWLVNAGFTKDKMVARPGEFALRGDILDIYPLNNEMPLRLEFFGDELDSIKEFDPDTQRSHQSLAKFAVLPGLDRIYHFKKFGEYADVIENQVEKAKLKLSVEDQTELENNFASTVIALREGRLPDHYGFLNQYLLEIGRASCRERV